MERLYHTPVRGSQADRGGDYRDTAPLALRPREAAASLGISLSTLDRLTRAGEIPVVKSGRVRLYRVAALNSYLQNRESAQNGAQA